MRSLAFLLLFTLTFVHARVTFPHSLVLQESDLDSSNQTSFTCKNSCQVYVDHKYDTLVITQNGQIVTDFNGIWQNGSEWPYYNLGLTFGPGDYKLENRGEADPVFVLYMVDRDAPHFGTRVIQVTDYYGFNWGQNDRYLSVLSSYDAIKFYGFEGIFPDGYPRIYSTGFDTVDDSSCRPVYQARSTISVKRSLLTIASALITIDFGYVGDHKVIAWEADLENIYKGPGASTVYMSPGYVGCSQDYGQFHSNLSAVHDLMIGPVVRLGIDALWNSLAEDEPLRIRIGDDEMDLVGTDTYRNQFGTKNGFGISWKRATPESSFSLQMDWAVQADPKPPTTTMAPNAIRDSYCDCAVDDNGLPDGWKSTDIWLDVVIVLDTSEAMGEESLNEAARLIESLIGDDVTDVLITDTTANLYTRIGVIAMSDSAKVLYDLDMTKSDTISDKVQVANGVKNIDVMQAFKQATYMFTDGLYSKPDRGNTHQVIYYMTDSDVTTVNTTLLDEFKKHGRIIVEQFPKNGEGQKGLDQIASIGYYFETNDRNPIQLFCKANCFCTQDRTPYSGKSGDEAVIAGGGCLLAPTKGQTYANAVVQCKNGHGKGLLASVHDPQKGAFLNEMVKTVTSRDGYFWIGYRKAETVVSTDDHTWHWEDNSTNPYTNWDLNQPQKTAQELCAWVEQEKKNLPWGAGNCKIVFPYVCEFAPCAVGYKNC